MKTLFINEESELIGLARQIESSGFPTKSFIKTPLHSMAGLDLVEKIPAWRPEMKWADLIISDANLTPAEQIALREWGRLLFGIGSIDQDAVGRLLNEQEPTDASDPHPVYWSLISFWNGRALTAPAFVVLADWFLLAGDLGGLAPYPMGATIWPNGPCEGRMLINPYIVEAVVDLLRKSDYRGPVEFQAMSNESNSRVFSVNTKINMTALAAIFKIVKPSPLDLMAEIAGGSMSEIPTHNLNAVSIRLYGPPWPWRLPLGVEIKDSIRINSGAEKHVYLADLWRGEEGTNDDERSAVFFGASGSLGLATAAGKFGSRPKDAFREARRRLARVVSGIHHPLLQYRIDAGNTATTSYEKLKSWKVI